MLLADSSRVTNALMGAVLIAAAVGCSKLETPVGKEGTSETTRDANARPQEYPEADGARGNTTPLRSLQTVTDLVLEGKSSKEVRDLVVRTFGPPDRDIGSGLSIVQWDFEEGVLTCHPGTGPVFDHKSGERTWLIQTHNPLEENLIGSYEMTTRPDARYHGTRFWIGNLTLRKDRTYVFVDSSQNLDHRAGQENNFFMLHPAGTFRLEFLSGLTAQTLLESVTEQTPIARLRFKARDGHAEKECVIVSYPLGRVLVFDGADELGFCMHKGWNNYWQ